MKVIDALVDFFSSKEKTTIENKYVSLVDRIENKYNSLMGRAKIGRVNKDKLIVTRYNPQGEETCHYTVSTNFYGVAQ